ncbi:molybdenum cofactor guanylyltransferase [Methanobrevibacter sp. DSM 116169]|uniref:molybdenum cofactor guanylyltransferase n=1 Tax=Methanobrevibacter sp. DSM 116169 TaxID=3242727 RepID=UPI0038FD1D56
MSNNFRSCILLCGGMSRRMGEDKGSMIIYDKPMIIHILDTLNHNIDEVIIVLNNSLRIEKYQEIINQQIYSFSIKFVEDEIKDKGPLSGIMTGLKNSISDYSLILPCDSPKISEQFLNYIYDSVKDLNKDALILYHDPKDKIKTSEPLHSVYSKSNYKQIEKLINENKLDVKSLIKEIDCEFIKIDNKNILKKDIKNFNSKKDIEMI